ncbi:MAG: hypothetical protein KF819_05195 [Labilithrix sp.]|nr:hypothetical protein [Labilithrix sp.]
MSRRAHLPTLVLFAASLAFRLPPLLNARSTNSDAAVVGLQAMHVLSGELSPLLWGSGYQTSVDAFVAALFFVPLGPTPFALMLSALSLHVLASYLVFATVRRRVDPWLALLVTMPLVVSPSSVHTYALYPPRQASLTLALAAFWAIDAATFAKRDASGWKTRGWLFAGAGCATLAVSADPYPLLLLPLLALHALLVAWPAAEIAEATSQARLTRFTAVVLGATVGLLPFVLLHRFAGAKSGPMGLSLSMLAHHRKLLVEECLPWALSYKVYFARDVMDYRPWAPGWFRTVGMFGACFLGALVAFGLLVAPLRREIPSHVRRLGLVGALVFPIAIDAFLLSVMVMDHFSMRYLAVLTLLTPFAVTPAAWILGRRRFLLAFAPHLIASAIGGWVGYGPFVRGLVPVKETPELRDDYALLSMLQQRSILYATADYWASYRLTFLFRERVVVVPTNEAEDRRAGYRRGLEAQPIYAYVYDPGRSREDFASIEPALAAESESVEKLSAGRLTVFVVTRRARP